MTKRRENVSGDDDEEEEEEMLDYIYNAVSYVYIGVELIIIIIINKTEVIILCVISHFLVVSSLNKLQ